MAKPIHEIRDPLHAFVRLSSDERLALDSRPFQRLRHIHQLATTYFIYPGATHKRFEHSLGVMELAGRVFDVVTHREHVSDAVREAIPELDDDYKTKYWRRHLRIAALCHDLGHLPFSHAAERELLPEGWNHERLTSEIIRSSEMSSIWDKMKLTADDVVKLAIGPKQAAKVGLTLTPWESILSEIIVGDAFGVDRMDYLLRDSHHAGVAYGKFDHFRLIDTLRILPPSPGDEDESTGDRILEPALGVEQGGIESAEALMLARYFMYSQVYFHPIRRIYDIHLKDFLKSWLPQGRFSTEVDDHLRVTDNEVTAAILEAARSESLAGHRHARRLVDRQHFKLFYQRTPNDVIRNPEAGSAVFDAACQKFGADRIRYDRYSQSGGAAEFPVQLRSSEVVSSLAVSDVLGRLPVVSIDYVFADREVVDAASDWLSRDRNEIIQPKEDTSNG